MLLPVLLCLINGEYYYMVNLDELHEVMLELINVFDNNGKDNITLDLFSQIWNDHKHEF